MFSLYKKQSDRPDLVIGVPRSFMLTEPETCHANFANIDGKTLDQAFRDLDICQQSQSVCLLLKHIDEVVAKDDLPIDLWVHGGDNRVYYCNKRFTARYGYCTGWKCHSSVMGNQDTCNCCKPRKALSDGKTRTCKLCRRFNLGYDIYVLHHPVHDTRGKTYTVTTSLQLENKDEVRRVLSREGQWSGKRTALFTCCSECNRVRVDTEKWIEVNPYFLQIFSGRISHGICRPCIKKLYPYLDISD